MDYTQIICSVIALLMAVITGLLVPYLQEKYGEAKLKKWQNYVDIAVEAAEQLFNTEQGEQKKAYVLKYLSTKGIQFDSSTVDKMIESAVLLLHNSLGGTDGN